ncbi:uncharacterized protein K02A2.6-like [Uranotaenia lowii]|uniref:uncharacterized protein K02A2.6-like n=1 Tax=Uranotaenia lowii TaxID=190385 RepID=UPI00247B071A|nr:uncharacterized protein K02A2.6-like [Uranotaenia lowii]
MAAAQAAGLKPPKPLVLGDNMAEVWKSWTRQFVWFATATQLNDKPPQVQVATFMTAIGADCIRIFDTINLTPEEENNLVVIKAKFDEYFIPKSCVTYERYVFNQISQNEDELTETFIARVKEQAKKCDFVQLHDSLVKDRIIIGLKFTKLMPQLLNDSLTLDKTIEMCRNHELTARQSQAMVSVAVAEKVEVLKMDRRERKSERKVDMKLNKQRYESDENIQCEKCGRNHKKFKCPAYGKECYTCGRRGHFATHCLIENGSGESSEEELFIGALEALDEGEDWFETVKVNISKVSVKLDTGAHCNVLPLWMVEKLDLLLLKPSPTKWLLTFSNHKMRVLGEVDPVCTVKQKQSRITFKVVEERVIPLLGRKTCIAQNLITRIDSLEIDDVEVYDGLGCLKGYIYDIDLVENAQWESRPARHVPHSIRDQVKKELDAMEKLGVIERIHEPTPVVSAMVLVRRNNKLRICIDPSQVNQNLLRRHHPLTTMEEISARLKNSKCFSILDCKKGFWQIRVTERTSKYLTFGTPWGRYCCKRLPFGLASAPEVFQKVMQDILERIDGVECSMDDVLIHAENESHLESITKEVISRIIASAK